MCSLYATNFLNSACLYHGSKLARLAWQVDTLLQKGRKIMELDANMADALVELIKDKKWLKGHPRRDLRSAFEAIDF